MCVYSQDPILSHLVGRYWYYQTGGGKDVRGYGTGENGYQADEGHGVPDHDNVHHDHGTVTDPEFLDYGNSGRNLETKEVLPASSYKLSQPAPETIPDTPVKLQIKPITLFHPPESRIISISAGESGKIGPVTEVIPSSLEMSSLSLTTEKSHFDYLVSESSSWKTTKTSPSFIPTPVPKILSSSLARVKQLSPGSGRIIRPNRLVASGS